MDIFHIIAVLLHNIGEAANGSGASGSGPGIIGGALGGWGSIMDGAVRGKIHEQAESQQQKSGDQSLDQRAQNLL